MKKIILIFTILLIPQLASAGVISLTTTVTSDVITGKDGNIHIKLLNSGNEAAYGVKISLLTESFESVSVDIGKLNTNEPIEKDLKISLTKTIFPGNYPVAVIIDYADANNYPFSSVSPTFIIYKNSTASKVSGIIPEISLTGKESKKFTLSIKNSDDKMHDLDIKLILPKEIKTTNSEKQISLQPNQERSLDFEISSVSAIDGSTYVVIASIEYEENNLHYSSFANGLIKIGTSVNPSKDNKLEQRSIYPYIVLVVSIIIVLIYIYPKYIRRGKIFERKIK